MGLERAGWTTISFSEIDPYACAVLAERWPGVPNLGSIVDVRDVEFRSDDEPRPSAASHALATAEGRDGPRLDAVGSGRSDWREAAISENAATGGQRSGHLGGRAYAGRDGFSGGVRSDWREATLWTGGFPCQDLSIAGKRRGLAGERSGLAVTFLELVGRHRPPWVLLENVPGLLSSQRGRDFASLLGRLSELGYGVAWRTLDARYFGVAQRRRRVFILATRDPGGRAGADRAAAVLSVAASGGGHPEAGIEAWPGSPGGVDGSPDIPRIYNATAAFGGWSEGRDAGAVSQRDYKSSNHLVIADPPDDARGEGRRGQGSAPLGEREPDPRDLPDADPVRRASGAPPDARGDGATDGLAGRLDDRQDVGAYNQRDRIYADLAPTLDSHAHSAGDAPLAFIRGGVGDDPLLPLGLDSHRYRCCGNGVVSNVAEAIGQALAAELAQDLAETA